jgi:radical SAM protein with 4Fe4S-binding SPASM domain
MGRRVSELHDRIIRYGLRPPVMLTLVITNGCNLKCRHCWPDSRSFIDTPSVPTKNIQRLIQEFAGLGLEKICITGGEPLTHPDWFKILSFCCKQRGFKEVRVQTNATLLTETIVSSLASLGFQDLSVQVSLEGATAGTHDRVRGQGSFERALRGLRLLVGAGLGKQTLVAFTEMRHNFEELPELLELVASLGIGRLVSATLVPGGRAARTNQLAPPDPSQYGDLLTLYHLDAKFRARYLELGNIAALEWYAGKSDPSPHVCTCIENPYVTADGRMYPCVLFQANEFAARGIHERPVDEVILETLPLWAEIKEMSHRRSLELKNCEGCPGRLHCAGGCMGRAFAVHGNAMSVEDRCALRRAVYTWKEPQIRHAPNR